MTSLQAIRAAIAHSDVTAFAAVVAIMEGGLVSGHSYKTKARIIKICKAEISKRVRVHDAAIKEIVGHD